MSTEPGRPSWWQALACPGCRRSLSAADDRLACGSCGAAFPVRAGVVHFLAATQEARHQLASADGTSMVRGYRRPNRVVAALRRIVTSEFAPGRASRRARDAVVGGARPLLVLGSGVTRIEGAVHLDLDDFPGVDVVANAHQLPFADGSLAGVLCEVVLEHVADPGRVIAETFRVLAPGGRCFFVVPFLFPYHGHPADYRRWSKQGLLAEFAAFRDLEAGIHSGPCSAMVNLLSEWLYVICGLRFPRGYVLVKGLATALLFWLKFADLLVARLPEAHRMAATLYVTGHKAAGGRG